MFKRQLLRQGRALSQSSAQKKVIQSAPFSRHFHASSPALRIPTTLSPRLQRRWQSTETAPKPDSEAAPATDAKPEAEQEDPLKKELEQKNREIVDLKDKYLRSVAEFRNLQDRTKRDMDSARQFAIQRFATDLLDSIDNLDRALGSVPEASLKGSLSSESTSSTTSSPEANVAAVASESAPHTSSSTQKDLANLHSGLRMTETILMSTLKKHGLERFDPLEGEGRKFDPRLDEATFFTKVEGKQDGEVFHTQSKGFTLNGRVIRAAKVGVVKNS